MLSASLPLSTLVAAHEGRLIGDPDGVIITDVVIDSRQIHRGCLFICVPGENVDGHDFASTAVAAGAVALIVERELDVDVPQFVVADARAIVGPASATVWDHPDQAVSVVGVTGTNGKTSIVSMLEQLGDRVGVGIRSQGTLTGQRTTPEACDIFRFLAQARADGVTAVAIEVSSHALALGRVRGIEFRLAVFTNLGRDHLDFHRDIEDYFAAKSALFTREYTDHALINTDDTYGRRLFDSVEVPSTPYAVEALDDVEIDRLGSRFSWHGLEVHCSVLGRHNVSNLLAVLETAHILGIADSTIVGAASSLRGAPGRFEMVPPADDIVVIVDYAHTPDGLEAVLGSAREVAGTGKLWVVFGCGGDRDRLKRPEMGRAAATLADRVVLTTDNPRSEDPADIVREIEAGARDGRAPSTVILDRFDAISYAISSADPGDVVVVAGKGHETTQTFADHVITFEDRVAAAQCLRERDLRRVDERNRTDDVEQGN